MYPCSLILNPKHSDHVKCKSDHSLLCSKPSNGFPSHLQEKKRQTYVLTIAYKFSSDIPYSPQPYHSLTLFPMTLTFPHVPWGYFCSMAFALAASFAGHVLPYTICMGSFLPSEDLCSNVTCSMSTSLSNCKVNLYSLGIP